MLKRANLLKELRKPVSVLPRIWIRPRPFAAWLQGAESFPGQAATPTFANEEALHSCPAQLRHLPTVVSVANIEQLSSHKM